MKNFIIRALTGFVYVGLLIGCTMYSPISCFLFFTLVAMGVVAEFSSLMNRYYQTSMVTMNNVFATMLLCAASWLYAVHGNGVHQAFALYGFMLLYILISQLYRKEPDPLRNWALTFASQLYIAVPFALIPFLCVYAEPIQYNSIFLLSVFVFIWVNDTGAYLSGCLLSRYFPAKLFPRISPKKSWVGSVGGGLLTLLASVVIYHYFPDVQSRYIWMGSALVVVVFGTWGDLVESLLKRQLGIKDSGNILPGHGGLLDRFDSVLISIPAVVIYYALVNA